MSGIDEQLKVPACPRCNDIVSFWSLYAESRALIFLDSDATTTQCFLTKQRVTAHVVLNSSVREEFRNICNGDIEIALNQIIRVQCANGEHSFYSSDTLTEVVNSVRSFAKVEGVRWE